MFTGERYLIHLYSFYDIYSNIYCNVSDIAKKNLKRLIRKYEFLLEDWEEVSEISKTANQEMSAEIHKSIPPIVKPSDFEVEEVEEEKQRPEGDPGLKKLFRKIVVKCHPDRMSGDLSSEQRSELLDLYDKAIEAHDSDNWALMVIVAIKLGVDLPEEANEKVSEIEEEVNNLENKIETTTKSTAWKWYHSGQDVRELIVNNYLKILEGRLGKNSDLTKSFNSKLILGLGHPRTGTGYTSQLLKSWGLDVGHETLGEHGTVDWSLAACQKSLWANGADFREWEWEHIIYCVRDPRDSIASIVATENVEGSSFNFRKQFNMRIEMFKGISSAIASILQWDSMITGLKPSFIYRIEDQSEELFKYLQSKGLPVKWSPEMIGKKYNQREHLSFEEMLALEEYIPKRYKIGIDNYCETYGYKRIFS